MRHIPGDHNSFNCISFISYRNISLIFNPCALIEYTLDKCKMLAEKVSAVSELPKECTRYPDAVKAATAKRTETKSAYAGMKGRVAAQANKAKGIESHAQIQRRLTNSRRFTKQA